MSSIVGCLFLGVTIPLYVDAGVVEEWVKHYDGAAHGFDRVIDLAVDESGNVLVTGESAGFDTAGDFATIKYDSAGNELWVSRYTGPVDSDDRGRKLRIDAMGNVYVAGTSTGADDVEDFLTVKYDIDGTMLWEQRYEGPLDNRVYDMTGDAAGNVYVTGYSEGTTSLEDCMTIKYDADGNELWVARYNGPSNSGDSAHAIFLDDTGNVYITGETWNGWTTGKFDVITIKYDNDGHELWTAQYRGPANEDDRSTDIIVDGSGNVYVTGRSRGVSSYDDYTTIKYDSSGTEQWAQNYNGPLNNFDIARSLVIDAAGNIYVTGFSGAGTLSDWVTIKYDTDGHELWVARYDGPENNADEALDLFMDAAGNIYVAGYATTLFGEDLAVVKYDSSGRELWVYHYDNAYHGLDRAYDIFVDLSFNVYVAGMSERILSDNDYVTIKLSQTNDIRAFSNVCFRVLLLLLMSIIVFSAPILACKSQV